MEKIKNLLNKDIKEFNSIVLSLLCIAFLVSAGIISYKINETYALFSDLVIGKETLNFSISSECDVNKPVLSSNMIPVYYDETCNSGSGCWKKADVLNESEEHKWYDYCEKKWANVATVTEASGSRSDLVNAAEGTEIPMDRINTMLVWIPRYKYKIFNYNESGTNYINPKRIDVVFENGIESTGTVKCTDDLNNIYTTSESCYDSDNDEIKDNVSTYTHPAFTFGTKEVTGIWVGKFENGNELTNITVKPNVTSIRNADVSTFATNIMAMNDSSNKYGFATNDDTHMMKNMEWGAVAYLTHSKFGLCEGEECKDIGVNNNSGFNTGCGAASGTASSTTCNTYNTESGMLASTTGNIYGIYDMYGAGYEYTMGNGISDDDKTMSSGTPANNSGYSSVVWNSTTQKFETFEGTYEYPNEKYYDKYSYSNNELQSKRGKLGDATREVRSTSGEAGAWYNKSSKVVTRGAPWFLRGGSYDTTTGGIFAHSYHYGNASNKYASRLVVSNTSNFTDTKNLCNFYGPYTTETGSSKTNYAYNSDKVYFILYCTSSSGVDETLSSEDIKSSNNRLLNNIKIISTTEYTSESGNSTGYKYKIETDAHDYRDEAHNVYLYINPYSTFDKAGVYDDGAKSASVNIGLLSVNKRNNEKPVITCDAISTSKETRMEKILSNRINQVGTGTRQAVVEAARFLALEFPYKIPYYWTDGLRNYPDTGHYFNKGLFLNEDRAWGCNIQKQAMEEGIFVIGGTYPNGLECSGFVSWALNNGGFENTGEWYTEIFKESSQSGKTYMYQNTYNPATHTSGYSNIFDYYMKDSAGAALASQTWNQLSTSSKKCLKASCGLSSSSTIDTYDIKAGDLIWKEGHVGMITGVTTQNSKPVYCVSEATYKISNQIFNGGLRTICYFADELYDTSLSSWTHVIKMDDIYGSGNLTNYKPYWNF